MGLIEKAEALKQDLSLSKLADLVTEICYKIEPKCEEEAVAKTKKKK